MSFSSWTKQWQDSFQNIDDLLHYLQLSRGEISVLAGAHPFPLRVPVAFAERMRKGDPNDPLLRQVLPLSEELNPAVGFTQDPLQEKNVNPLSGLLHKYKSRVLLTLSGACAVHCRYCFRRHFPYQENNFGKKGWKPVFEYLLNHHEVNEVILSGGDPLVVVDEMLGSFIQRLEAVPSIRYLRIHTRLPIVIPARITDTLIKILSTTRFRVTMVLHSNHANEWHESLAIPMKSLKKAGITLLNQSVLLREVNDTLSAQLDLSYRLFDYGVLPYYLHLLDKVAGAAHFDVEHSVAIELMKNMVESLPGYLVPKLVREIPHRASKVPVDLGMY